LRKKGNPTGFLNDVVLTLEWPRAGRVVVLKQLRASLMFIYALGCKFLARKSG